MLLAITAPLPVKYQRVPVDNHIQEAADKQAKNQPGKNNGCLVHLDREQCCQIAWPRLKIGRYIAMTMVPTMTPMMTMIIGSIRLVRTSTAVSTSSS